MQLHKESLCLRTTSSCVVGPPTGSVTLSGLTDTLGNTSAPDPTGETGPVGPNSPESRGILPALPALDIQQERLSGPETIQALVM